MKCRGVILTLALLVWSLESVLGGFSDDMTRATQKCCTKGTQYARNHTSKDCKSSVPDKVAPMFVELCTLAMNQCCYSFFDQKKECDTGIDQALDANKCNGVADPKDSSSFQYQRTCCNRCLQGSEAGKQGQICSRLRISDANEDGLPDEAYTSCCEKASKKEERIGSHAKNTNSSKIPLPLSTTYSVCEEYAPNELCAHHCIAVPGSYRCECNPGFRLMSDKKNCIEEYTKSRDRCKTHNPCQHKCNDIGGGKIKCSCRKGYSLMGNGKSCNDIDECMKPNVCPAGTKCKNYDGSYKCISTFSNKAEGPSKGECPPGFAKNLMNGACDDVDECQLQHAPCPSDICENTIGGYKCDGMSGDPRYLNALPVMSMKQGEDKCPPGFRSGGNEECEDEDECASHQNNCNSMSQFCINTRGSFFCQDRGSKRCPPGFKINNKSHRCEDIDECVDDHDQSLCPSGKVCVNVPGAYDCKEKELSLRSHECPEGMRKKQGSTVCEDINECVEGTHLCDQHQSCLNTNGGHECHCKAGFKLDEITGACVDVNECLTDQNDCIAESQRCDNTIGSFLCIRVMPCGTGYVLQYTSGICEDIDECALGIDNCANQSTPYNCVNIPGSFNCVKPPAAAHTEDEYYDYYYDSGEVTTTTKKTTPQDISLQPNIIIKNISEITPEIKDQSDKNSDIKANDPKNNEIEEIKESIEEIKSTPKLVFLNVPKETELVNGIKEDGALVLDTKDVAKNVWTKIDGKPDIACPIGFEIDDNGTCVDIDECVTNRHVCKPTVETCHNNVGGYICECSIGYRRDFHSNACIFSPTVPSIINTLATGLRSAFTFNTELPSSTSSSTVLTGSSTEPTVSKTLLTGSSTEPTVTSTETTVKSTVPTISSTEHTVPSSTASTLLSSEVLSATVSSSTLPPSSSSKKSFFWWDYPENRGTQRPFKSRNLCDAGFHMNSDTAICEDINECTNGQQNCADVEVCVNTDGGYRCECPPNWVLDEVRHRCVPRSDRNKFPEGYGNVPRHGTGQSEPRLVHFASDAKKNKVPPTITALGNRGNVLKCPWGYKLSEDNTCQDINECTTDPSVCGEEQICTNLAGGYTCQCPSGHKLSADQTCQDVDECDLAGDKPICSQNAECINTIGSYKCQCHDGYRNAAANDKVCMDVDECVEARSGSLCQHRCNNIWGGYKCSCHRGYKLNADNKTCSDVDECQQFKDKHLCIGKCVNEPGSYRCTCPNGYRLSGDVRSCVDIDECETGEAHCAAEVKGFGVRSFCLNTRGAYKCEKISCPRGYELETKHRCTKVNQECPLGDWNCTHQPVTISYNYITFVSHLDVGNEINLYTMKGPTWAEGSLKFQLRLANVDAPPSVKKKADINSFLFKPTDKHAAVLIVESLEGPQTIELEVTMEIYYKGHRQLTGKAVAKLFIYVSEFDF